MDLNKTRLDLTALEEGRWFPFYEDLEVRISSSRGARYQKALDAMQSTRRRDMPKVDADDESTPLKRLVADYLVHDWRNLKLGGPDDVPFSPDKAFELFCDPQLVEFYQWVIGVAGALSQFREQRTEEAVGN